MSRSLEIVTTIADLRDAVAAWRMNNLSIGLVPTMGALHEGHFSLVERSVAANDCTCVTIFVNPRQFGPGEDFDEYPRDQEADKRALADHQVDLLFAPTIKEMYPDGFVTRVSVAGIGDLLEGAFRPGFFDGVATVVSKLLIQSLPDRAYFGEKDYQQLCVVRQIAFDLDLPVEIISCPIVREEDSLAVSSRNAFLTAEQRAVAPALYRILTETAEFASSSAVIGDAISTGINALLEAGFTKVDYIAICDPVNLKSVEKFAPPVRVLGAAWLKSTRLIDNVQFG